MYADALQVGKDYAMGIKPLILGADMGFFEGLSPDRRPYYFNAEAISDYARQVAYLNNLKREQDECQARYYPPPTRPKRYVKGTDMEWPGPPMSEIPMPTPEEMKPPEVLPKRVKPPPTPTSKLHLRMTMAQSYGPNPDKLILWIDLTEISERKEYAIKAAEAKRAGAV